MTPRTSSDTAIICAAAVVVVGLLTVPFALAIRSSAGTAAGNSGYLFWTAAAGVAALGLILGFVYLITRKRAQVELTSGEQYRSLAEEYRRLADMAITAQEHTDLRLSDLRVQLDYLREQNESMQKILRDVE